MFTKPDNMNILSRNNSSTNPAKDGKYQQEINEHKKEIKLLKQSKKEQHNPKTEIYKSNIILEKRFLCLTGANKKVFT